MSEKSAIAGTMMAFATYKAKEGMHDTLMELVKCHIPTLRENGLITDKTSYTAISADGTVIEVFEWVNNDAVRTAHSHPAISAIWDKMIEVADFIPMKDLPEAGRPFPGFAMMEL